MNVGKSKVLRCSRYGNPWRLNACNTKRRTVRRSGLFQVYLGSQVAADGGYERDVIHSTYERC